MLSAATPVARDPDDDEDGDPTQPFSAPGRPYVTQEVDCCHEFDHDDGNSFRSGGGDTETTLSNSCEENRETSEVDMTYRNTTTTWKNADGQTRCIEGLHLDIYLHRSTNTAIFKMYGYVLLKGSKGKSSKQAIYLYLHPEEIQSISLEAVNKPPSLMSTALSSSRYSLCFSMATEPLLVVPKNLVLESRPKTRALLDSIRTLATVTNFTVHLNDTDMVTSTRTHLELIASIFSSTKTDGRPCTNNKRANLTTLYAGRGGDVVNTRNAVTNIEQCIPPSYDEPPPSRSQISNKRKRRNSDTAHDHSSTAQNPVLLILKDICTRLGNIEDRIGRLENRVSEALDANCSPCRYGTEERIEMLEEIDSRIDDCITDLKVESHDIIQELRDEVDGELERIETETNEKLERLETEVEENTPKLVENSLRKKLLNASLRIDGTVFLDT